MQDVGAHPGTFADYVVLRKTRWKLDTLCDPPDESPRTATPCYRWTLDLDPALLCTSCLFLSGGKSSAPPGARQEMAVLKGSCSRRDLVSTRQCLSP